MRAAAAFPGLLFGLGALVLLVSQPVGRARPTLATRLEALRPRAPEPPSETPPAFKIALLETAIRPLIERAGSWLASVGRLLGVDLTETEKRLALVGDRGGLMLFLGQKLAAALVVLAVAPMATAIGLLSAMPPWLWLASGTAAFVLPDSILRLKADTSRRELREGLARFADLMSLAVSAGLGLEGALDEVSRSGSGPFFVRLRKVLREAGLRGESASSAVGRLHSEFGLAEAEPLASALASAEMYGLPISRVLRVQAASIRERRRLELVEAGERAQVRMYFPVGGFILPAFFLLIMYPAAVQLLQLSAR